MSTDTLIQQIREEFGSLDARGEQLVLATMKIMRRDEGFAAERRSNETFVGHNITLEEYERLSEDDKRRYHDQAELDNQHWVDLQLLRLDADWIMVVDGQVVLSGATLKEYPEEDDLLALCQKTGKFPFVFYRTVPTQPDDRFISENITLEKYESLPQEEKHRYFGEAKKLNGVWIETEFDRLKAKWIMVVDGKVISHGASLSNYPDDEEFVALCRKTGKYPFVFFSPIVFAIEEQRTAWHKTNLPDDFYPAVSVTISGHKKHITTEADLDTGAIDCFCDMELMLQSGVVKTQPWEFEDVSEHLSRPFVYQSKRLVIRLTDDQGVSHQFQTTGICVHDWHNSPFCAINPGRTFLLGREALLRLKPRLVLDFEDRQTEVKFKSAKS